MPETMTSARLLPTGTVTFLFTDIEGSTKLLEQLRDRYAIILAESSDILRMHAEKFGGVEVDTQGDAFFIAFPRAQHAIAFACESQRALAAHAWPDDVRVKIRMGLHTGQAVVSRVGYVGMDVHRAARIAASAHGGQVVLSPTTRALLDGELPEHVGVRDLGEFKLKDVGATRIFQLDIAGLATEFPPLKTLDIKHEPPAPGEPPFMGLKYFDAQNANLFFGREAITARLIERLRQEKFLAVVGASGSGKSSVVRAGVIPALRSTWHVHILTPTANPLEALAAELARASDSVAATARLMDDLRQDSRSLSLYLTRHSSPTTPHVLVVIDQFEELFTLCRDENARRAFIHNFLYATKENAATVILTLRADFYAALADYQELRDAVAQHQEYIGPMTREELRRAIEEPAKRNRASNGDAWEFDAGLVDLILHDVGNEPGALPLLSHALLESWNRRSGTRLMLKSYEESGGVRGAIAKTAERVFYQDLDAHEQNIARNIFLRLTELGEGTQDTRRRASLSELVPRAPYAEAEQVQHVLQRLADARLITTDEGVAQVAHEALIREWHTLREWLNQDREGLRLHRQLTQAAQEWELLERDADALYRGARLIQTQEYASAHPEHINASERAFLDASVADAERAEREKELARQRELEQAQLVADVQRQRAEEQIATNQKLRRRAFILAGVVVLALFAAGAAVFFLTQSNANLQTANTQRDAASNARATAAANESAAVAAKNEAEQERNAATNAQATAVANERVATARELAASANENLGVDPERSMLLALQAVDTTRNADNSVLREAEEALHRAVLTSRILKTLPAHQGIVSAMAYSPDGTRLATGGEDKVVRIWDTTTYENVLTIAAHDDFVNSIAYSPDSKRLATGSDDGSAKVWDAATGKLLFELKGHTAPVYPAVFSPDGKQLATLSLDNTVKFWNAANSELQQTWELQDPGAFLLYSPDGTRVFYVDAGALRVREVRSGQELYSVPVEDYVFALSPGGKKLAVESDGVIRVLDASNGQPLYGITPPNNRIERMAFSPDSSRLAAAGRDRLVHVWDAANGEALFSLAGHSEFIYSIAYSPDGKRLASGAQDGTVKFWSLEPRQEVLSIPVAETAAGATSPDGTRIAAPVGDSVRVWDAADGALLFENKLDGSGLAAVAYSPDGKELATGGADQTLRVLDAKTGKLRLTLPVTDKKIRSIAYRPDGKVFAVAGSDGMVRLYDHADGKVLASWDAGLGFLSVIAYSPDGQRLGAASFEANDVKVFDAATGKERLTLQGHTNNPISLDFSHDGSRIVTGGRDGTARIWDAATGALLATLTGHTSTVTAARFSPDDTRVATRSNDGTMRVWDAATGKELLMIEMDGVGFDVEFTPDGSHLVVGDLNAIKVLTLQIEELMQLAKSRLTRTWTPGECAKYLHHEQCP